MPHSNGIIYTEPNVDSTKPDWGTDLTGDVAVVLNVNSGDTGTLCSHENINKWAKHKPIVYANVIAPLTDAQFKEKNYGLTVPPNPLTDGYTKIDDVILNAEDAYVYTKPSGRKASPYRISDFNKYSHSAKAPINGFPETIYIRSNVTTRILNFPINQSSDYAIGLTDLPSDFNSWYLAFAVKKNNVWNVKTSRYTINSGKGDYIYFNFGNSSASYDGQTYLAGFDGNVIEVSHTYECIICLCHTKINDFTQLASTQNQYKFYPAPVQDIDSMRGAISRVSAEWGARIMLKELYRAGVPSGIVSIGLSIGHSGAEEGETYSMTDVSWVVNYRYTSASSGSVVTGTTITGSRATISVTGNDTVDIPLTISPDTVISLTAWGTMTYNTSQTFTFPETTIETVQEE